MNVDEAAWQIVARGLLGRNRPDTNDAVRQLMQGADGLWPQVIHLADTNFVSPGLWKALADRILGYGEIGQLILAFHSYGGGLMIGNRIRDLDQKKVKDLFFPRSGKLPPKTDSIIFEGCSIAQRPVRMANFARWFRARQVSGRTSFATPMRIRRCSSPAPTSPSHAWRKRVYWGRPPRSN